MKIKAVFSEENNVPQSQIESTALYCVTIIQAEIHQLFQGRACSNIILVKILKLQSAVVTLDIRPRSSKSNFLTPNKVSMQIWRERSGSVVECLTRDRGFEPHRRHCVVVLEKDTFILV